MKRWRKLKSSIVYDSKYFRVRKDTVKLPGGEKKEWTYWDSEDSAMVLGMTKEKKLVMIKQYRYLTNKEVVEFPSGGLKSGESARTGAKREFEEETGYVCSNLIKLGSFYETYGQLNRKIHIFFANAIIDTKQSLDSGEKGFEDIEVELLNLDEVIALVNKGGVDAMGSTLAALLLKEMITKGKIII